jgi:hypothetical protein
MSFIEDDHCIETGILDHAHSENMIKRNGILLYPELG